MDLRHCITHLHRQYHLQQEISVQYVLQANYVRRRRIRQNVLPVVPQMNGQQGEFVHLMMSLLKELDLSY